MEEMVKSVVKLWLACLSEAGQQHDVRIQRDAAYAESRIEHEGLAFLAITLPSFEKDFLTGISRGYVDSDLFLSFRKSKGGLPAFMSGFLRRVFDSTGALRSDVDASIIRSIRQVLLLVSKIELPTSRERDAEALKGYVETDAGMEDIPAPLLEEFALASRRLLTPYFAEVENRLYHGDWLPRYSSGATADRLSYNSRFSQRTWTTRLNEVFPWWEDLAVTPREVIDHAEDFVVLSPEQEPPVRVITVPKTMKGPRIIAMEPSWMQFVQQGILAVMSETLQLPRYRDLRRVFSWLDQDPNRVLAREGSRDGSYATLDLSEASDRVHLQLVEAMLADTPFLRRCVLACRSNEAVTSKGDRLVLNKFASMGSALCFPIESMVFYIIEALAVAEVDAVATADLAPWVLPKMRVFGDDLIVPEKAARTLMEKLEAYGLKVNARKSFTSGLFRESCGSDWYRGEDVSVFRLKSPPPPSGRHAGLMERFVAFHNRAYEFGWYGVAKEAERHLRQVFPRIPRALPGDPVSALWSWEGPTAVRTSPTTQATQVRALVYNQRKNLDELGGYGALKKHYHPHPEPRDKDHLQRDGRSQHVSVNVGWVAVS